MAYWVLHPDRAVAREALGEEREADLRLQEAYEDVAERLHRIQDPSLREGALYGNRAFREVCEARRRTGV